MPDGSSAPPLELAEALAVIDRLRPQLAGDVVLIGGQAIALWRAQLDPWLSPEAMPQEAIASNDIDFTGSKADVRAAAGLLNGTARVAPARTGLLGADVLEDAVFVPLAGLARRSP
jgi:hypothetical protein